MSKNRASMNISGVMCRCHRQMCGNLSKKTQIIDRSFKSKRISGWRPSSSCIDVIMQLTLRRRSLSVRDSSRSPRGFREGNGRGAPMRRSSAPGVFLLLLKAVFFIKPKELINSAERGGRFEHHKNRMLVPNGTSNGRRYDSPLSLFNIGFVFSLRRLKRHERAPFTNDALRRLCFFKDAPVRPGGP